MGGVVIEASVTSSHAQQWGREDGALTTARAVHERGAGPRAQHWAPTGLRDTPGSPSSRGGTRCSVLAWVVRMMSPACSPRGAVGVVGLCTSNMLATLPFTTYNVLHQERVGGRRGAGF